MEWSFNSNFFFSAPCEVLLPTLQEAFSWDLERLKRAYSIHDSSSPIPSAPSPSRLLNGIDHDEVNRTLTSVLALRWIHNEQYEVFVAAQPEPVHLFYESFDWIRDRVAAAVADPAGLTTLITAVIINDLGKDSTLASDYY